MLEKDMRKQIIEQWEGVLRVTPIESPGTQRSIPDLHARSRTADWWIELKQATVMAMTGEVMIPWRPGQRNWLRHHDTKNGNVALIITIGTTYYIIQSIERMLKQYYSVLHLQGCSNYYGIIWNAPKDLWERK